MGDFDVAGFATFAAWVLIVFGFFSIFFPIAPSIPMIWFGIFVYAISHHFQVIDRGFMTVVSALAVATIFLDYTLYKFGIQKFRAGFWSVFGAIVGFAIGSFFQPIYQYLIGPVLGAVTFELLRGRDQVFSFKRGNTTVVAFMGGTIVKLIAGITMIGLFILRLQEKL